jgi:hypothetical protein
MSIPEIASIIILLFFFITLFGILGVNLWSQSFDYRCRLTPAPVNGSWPVDPNITTLCGDGGLSCPQNTYCGSNYDYSD